MENKNQTIFIIIIIAVLFLYGGKGFLGIVYPLPNICSTPTSCNALDKFFNCEWVSMAGDTIVLCGCASGYVFNADQTDCIIEDGNGAICNEGWLKCSGGLVYSCFLNDWDYDGRCENFNGFEAGVCKTTIQKQTIGEICVEGVGDGNGGVGDGNGYVGDGNGALLTFPVTPTPSKNVINYGDTLTVIQEIDIGTAGWYFLFGGLIKTDTMSLIPITENNCDPSNTNWANLNVWFPTGRHQARFELKPYASGTYQLVVQWKDGCYGNVLAEKYYEKTITVEKTLCIDGDGICHNDLGYNCIPIDSDCDVRPACVSDGICDELCENDPDCETVKIKKCCKGVGLTGWCNDNSGEFKCGSIYGEGVSCGLLQTEVPISVCEGEAPVGNTCKDKYGEICPADEYCSKSFIPSSDSNRCCPVECVETIPEETQPTETVEYCMDDGKSRKKEFYEDVKDGECKTASWLLYLGLFFGFFVALKLMGKKK